MKLNEIKSAQDLHEGTSARKSIAEHLDSLRSEIPSYLNSVRASASEAESLKQMSDLKKLVKGKASEGGHCVTWKHEGNTLKLAFMLEPFKQGEKTRDDGKIAWQLNVSGQEEFTVTDHDRSRSLIGALGQLSSNMKKGR